MTLRLAKLIADKRVRLLGWMGLEVLVAIEFPAKATRDEVYDCISRGKGRVTKYRESGESEAYIPTRTWNRESKKEKATSDES